MVQVPRSLTPLLCAMFVACASYGRPLPEVAPEINATYYIGPTLIEPGDNLDVRFPRKSEWNLVAGVRSDGRVSLPLLGEVRVAGNSVSDLERILEQDYRQYLEEPEVTINIGNQGQETRETGGGLVVTGEVGRPGMVVMLGERLTLVEALGRAGGHLKATALLGNTLLLRRSHPDGGYLAWRIDAREDHWDVAEPVWLQRHDLVFVPNTPIDNVNIWVDQYINKMIPYGAATFALGIAVGAQ